MSARQQMTMRAVWQRNEATKNAYNLPGPANWKTLDLSLPCFVWIDNSHLVDNTGAVQVSEPKAMVPKGKDFKVGDRFESVKDRAGNDLFGTMTIETISLRSDHQELRLKKVA